MHRLRATVLEVLCFLFCFYASCSVLFRSVCLFSLTPQPLAYWATALDRVASVTEIERIKSIEPTIESKSMKKPTSGRCLTLPLTGRKLQMLSKAAPLTASGFSLDISFSTAASCRERSQDSLWGHNRPPLRHNFINWSWHNRRCSRKAAYRNKCAVDRCCQQSTKLCQEKHSRASVQDRPHTQLSALTSSTAGLPGMLLNGNIPATGLVSTQVWHSGWFNINLPQIRNYCLSWYRRITSNVCGAFWQPKYSEQIICLVLAWLNSWPLQLLLLMPSLVPEPAFSDSHHWLRTGGSLVAHQFFNTKLDCWGIQP